MKYQKQKPTTRLTISLAIALLSSSFATMLSPSAAHGTAAPAPPPPESTDSTTGSSPPLDSDPFESIVGDIDVDGVDTGIEGIDSGFDGIDDGIGDVTGGVDDVSGSIDDIEGVEDIEDVAGGVDGVTDGIGSITDGIDSIGDSISGIFDAVSDLFSLERLLDLINIDLGEIFSDPLGGLDGGGSSGVEIVTGPLGLPDPETIEEEIQNAETTAFQEFAGARTGGEGSPVIKNDLGTLFEREMTDEVAAQTALTEEGQQKLVENSEIATQTLEASKELSADSEGQDVSQNILRNISSQMALAQQTNSLDTIDRQLQRRDSALRNRMLVNAVRELQADRIQDRRTTAAAYSDAITQGGQLLLPGVGIDPAGD